MPEIANNGTKAVNTYVTKTFFHRVASLIFLIVTLSSFYLLGVYSGTGGQYTELLIYSGLDKNNDGEPTILQRLDLSSTVNKSLYPKNIATTNSLILQEALRTKDSITYLELELESMLNEVKRVKEDTSRCDEMFRLIDRATSLNEGK